LSDGNSQLVGNPGATKLVRIPLRRWSVAALSGAAVHPIYRNDEDCVFIKIAPHNLARNGLELLMVVIVKAISSKTKTYLVFLQRLDFSGIMPNPFPCGLFIAVVMSSKFHLGLVAFEPI
jgi:hypothetical protein